MGDLAAPSAAQGAGVSRRIATNILGMGGTGGGSSLGTVILVLRTLYHLIIERVKMARMGCRVCTLRGRSAVATDVDMRCGCDAAHELA